MANRRILRTCGSVVEAAQLAERLVEAGYPVTVLGSSSSSAYMGVNEDREVWIENADLLEDASTVEEIAKIIDASRWRTEDGDTFGGPLVEPDDPHFITVMKVIVWIIVLVIIGPIFWRMISN
ncbi:MAG: hypothetical protein ABL962_17040 [Fimbriimonadaceae bacterium]